MTAFIRPILAWLSLLVVMIGMTPALAQEATENPDPNLWQSVISSQVQAFRDHNAPEALSYAGQGFQKSFSSPEAFFVTIMASGYSPIMESRSHNFGEFQMIDADRVAQIVNFVGPAQELYKAIYVLAREESGWRVQGVQLTKTAAVGI